MEPFNYLQNRTINNTEKYMEPFNCLQNNTNICVHTNELWLIKNMNI